MKPTVEMVLRQNLKVLKLSTMDSRLEEHIRQASQTHQSYTARKQAKEPHAECQGVAGRRSRHGGKNFRRVGFCLSHSDCPTGSLRHSGKSRRRLIGIVVERKKSLTFMNILFHDE